MQDRPMTSCRMEVERALDRFEPALRALAIEGALPTGLTRTAIEELLARGGWRGPVPEEIAAVYGRFDGLSGRLDDGAPVPLPFGRLVAPLWEAVGATVQYRASWHALAVDLGEDPESVWPSSWLVITGWNGGTSFVDLAVEPDRPSAVFGIDPGRRPLSFPVAESLAAVVGWWTHVLDHELSEHDEPPGVIGGRPCDHLPAGASWVI